MKLEQEAPTLGAAISPQTSPSYIAVLSFQTESIYL